MLTVILSALAQGSLYAIMGLGVYITFRILNTPDLTTEGAFVVGASIGAAFIQLDFHPLINILIVFLAGAAAGAITALMITAVGISPLIAGIITMTGVYSLNLRFMGSSNISLAGKTTIYDLVAGLHLPRNLDTLLVGLVIAAIIIGILSLFFKTEMGQALIATGDNIHMARALGIQTKEMQMLGYMLANGLVAVSGSLISQNNGYADINSGVGTVVIGLAAVVLGEVIFPNVKLLVRMATIIVGAIVYQLLLTLVLQLNFNTEDFKLFSALILAICLAIPALRGRLMGRRQKKGTVNE
ncbi:branched-chain amino acid ABC transporter permease [Aerococcus urinaehominis]|uniref:Branched-chain amino acid ABC transporter permease n=1 Tax=Aerococcus urinaehominis TaxID=128944 RepID=A0A0X8FJP1_9LACT|nr:branched-chain amino acid ABC transporter permease [Aerococcus urinaehominis]AMB98535.1 branched-chain amino acid ABC transporter permease [Aerococcus urinaehominis]SDL79063.1 putative ABC transport system permease protein [Aerococcus urinaehominis]